MLSESCRTTLSPLRRTAGVRPGLRGVPVTAGTACVLGIRCDRTAVWLLTLPISRLARTGAPSADLWPRSSSLRRKPWQTRVPWCAADERAATSLRRPLMGRGNCSQSNSSRPCSPKRTLSDTSAAFRGGRSRVGRKMFLQNVAAEMAAPHDRPTTARAKCRYWDSSDFRSMNGTPAPATCGNRPSHFSIARS